MDTFFIMNGVTRRRMDETDLRLCQLLIENSRRPQRELAEELGIGVAGVHRRIQSLVDQKVVRGFRANISSAYLRGYRHLGFGHLKYVPGLFHRRP